MSKSDKEGPQDNKKRGAVEPNSYILNSAYALAFIDLRFLLVTQPEVIYSEGVDFFGGFQGSNPYPPFFFIAQPRQLCNCEYFFLVFTFCNRSVKPLWWITPKKS